METDKPPSRAPGDTGPPKAGLPGTKYLARGGALFIALPTRGQGSGSVLSLEGGMIFAPLRFSSLLHLTPPLLCGPGSSRDPNYPRIANEEVRQMPLLLPPLPRLSFTLPSSGPGVQQMLLIRGPHAAQLAPRWVGKLRADAGRNEPRKLRARRFGARTLSCEVSPSCGSRRPACAPRPPALPRWGHRETIPLPRRSSSGFARGALPPLGAPRPPALSGPCHPV